MTTNFSIPQNRLQGNVCLDAADQAGIVRFQVDPSSGELLPTASAIEGSLVLNAEFVSAISKTDDKGHFERIKRRFDLQEVASRLLPGERVCRCLKWRFEVTQGVGIQFSESIKRAFFSNLQTCGQAWVDPVCAAKISERQRVELAGAVEQWRLRGGSLLLVTLTMRHSAEDSLVELLRDMNLAYRATRGGRAWQRFEKQFRIVGSVTAHEITYGQESGFHPHKHLLIFSEGSITTLEQAQIWLILTARWQAKLAASGRSASDLVGVKVQEGYGNVSEYVAKWGLVEEVTKSNAKAGRINGKSLHYSPFQLLDLVRDGSPWAGPVFVDYVSCTKGLSRLRWSPGLRDLFDLGEELSDLEIAEKQDEKAVLLLTLLWPVWSQVLKSHARAMLLEVAGTGQVDLVYSYLVGLGISKAAAA